MPLSSNIESPLGPTTDYDQADSLSRTIHGRAKHSFHYQPLNLKSSSHQIRLLRFPPSGSSPAKIACTMQIVDLNSKPAYRALFYTWGPPEPTMEILVNDRPFRVRENLYQFLSTWQDKIDYLIWIDQIVSISRTIVRRITKSTS